MVTMVKALIALMLMLSGTTGSVDALQASLPGSPIYAVKLQFEDWKLGQIEDPAEQANAVMAMARHRVMEAVQLAQEGEEIPMDVPARFAAQVQMALQASGTLTEPLRLQAWGQISETLGLQLRIMQQLHLGEGEEGEPVRAMIQTMEQARAHIGGSGDPNRPPSGYQYTYTYGSEGDASDGVPNGDHEAGHSNGNSGGNGGGNGGGH